MDTATALVLAVVGIILGAAITRWIFAIEHFLSIGKTQIGLLIMIAKRNGASKEEIDEILDTVYGKNSRLKKHLSK